MNSKNQNHTQSNSHNLLQDITRGLLYTHTRINANTTRTLEVASFLYTLIELLSEKEILSIEELDERKKQVAGRLVRKFVESKIGLLYQNKNPECNKFRFGMKLRLTARTGGICAKQYAASFLLPCQCRMWRRVLSGGSSADLLIALGADGYCVRPDRENYKCTMWEPRTLPEVDCEYNEKWKVWADYGEKIVMERIDRDNRTVYNGITLLTIL
jgi:hypothetical protein